MLKLSAFFFGLFVVLFFQVVMAQLPAEQQAKLAKVAEGLSAEQAKSVLS